LGGFGFWVVSCQTQTVFLFLPTATLGTQWMNWALLACIPTTVLALQPLREQYQRLSIDQGALQGTSANIQQHGDKA
jgi:hypothetical protein